MFQAVVKSELSIFDARHNSTNHQHGWRFRDISDNSLEGVVATNR